MAQSPAEMRRDYQRAELLEENVHADPIEQFRRWFDEARAADITEPNAMTLATAGNDGIPSARIVLLKGFDANGFVFYTNYASEKGEQLAQNPHAALVFAWLEMERQVRISGQVEKITVEESRAYFQARPRGSQLGALVSRQSQPVASRTELDQRYEAIAAEYADDTLPIPMPDHWGGYRLRPERIEFWQGRGSRLHDRLRYTRPQTRSVDAWRLTRLEP